MAAATGGGKSPSADLSLVVSEAELQPAKMVKINKKTMGNL
ncbi:hypothetical protein [Paenibacillus sp. TH7-28]